MDSDMKANTSLTTKATLYLASCSLVTACGSLVSLDDDVPAPPVPREARQLRITPTTTSVWMLPATTSSMVLKCWICPATVTGKF